MKNKVRWTSFGVRLFLADIKEPTNIINTRTSSSSRSRHNLPEDSLYLSCQVLPTLYKPDTPRNSLSATVDPHYAQPTLSHSLIKFSLINIYAEYNYLVFISLSTNITPGLRQKKPTHTNHIRPHSQCHPPQNPSPSRESTTSRPSSRGRRT